MEEKSITTSNIFYKEFQNTYREFSQFDMDALHLCAAENAVSNFTKIPLTSSLHEKYIMGGILEYQKSDNFVGSEILFKFYEIIDKLCAKLFHSAYADARTLTGMNSLTTLLMSLFKIGDHILISNSDCGGHGSIPSICHRLGVSTTDIPYNYEQLDFDYEKTNKLLKTGKYKGILVGLSDMLYPPDFAKLNMDNDITLIYDATQVLGLIAGAQFENPFDIISKEKNVILMGATHKTLPGPSCGLIMTNNVKLAKTFDTEINPNYIRNVQLHQVISLLFTLIEFDEYGSDYSKKIVENTDLLSNLLEPHFNLIRRGNENSRTHQIHFTMTGDELTTFYNNSLLYKVTLNRRDKKIYKPSGIRIGTQEITRYGYNKNNMNEVANILTLMKDQSLGYYNEDISKQIKALSSKKDIQYAFNPQII